MPVLYYESGDGAGRKVEFADSVVLGRLKTAAVPIPDPEASREHTRVVRESDGWYAVDCGSRNGTEVNGAKVTRHRLRTGDRIRIAKTVLRFEDAAAAVGPGSTSESRHGSGEESAPQDRAVPIGLERAVNPVPHAAPPIAPPLVLPANSASRPSGRVAPPAPAPAIRPSGAQAPRPAAAAPSGGPLRPHAPTGPSGATQAVVFAVLAALFVGLVFLSRWIAGMAIDRMVQSQRQEQPK